MALTQTGRVLLGLIAAGVSTGYELRQLIRQSTAYFWGASAGGIYPELHRLEREGLLAGSDVPRGAQHRRAYRLTPEGRRVLDAWLSDDTPGVFALRHEGMLRLFLASRLAPDRQPDIARSIADQHAALRDELTALRATLEDRPGDELATLDFGIALNGFIADWFARDAAS
jgi:PadR family transcriptional regulator AphA